MIYQASRHEHIAVDPHQSRSEVVCDGDRKVVGALVDGEGSPMDAFDDCAPLSFRHPSLHRHWSRLSNSSYTSPFTYSTFSYCATDRDAATYQIAGDTAFTYLAARKNHWIEAGPFVVTVHGTGSSTFSYERLKAKI